MRAKILIAGGYGVVGSAAARILRAISPELEIVLGGRKPEAGAALAAEIGARTARIDLDDPATFDAAWSADLVVACLHDPKEALLDAAGAHGAAFLGVTSLADTFAPLAFSALAAPPRRVVAPFGHWVAGLVTLAAQAAAAQFQRIDEIEAIALFDPSDALGPMSAGDAEHLVGRALVRRDGAWTWVEAMQHPRHVAIGGEGLMAIPMGLLDVASFGAITGARAIRFDLAQGVSAGTRGGGPASHDIEIALRGVLAGGAAGSRRVSLSDPRGIAHMTALGIAIAAERILGLDGAPRPAGGLYLPETLLCARAALSRAAAFGVRFEEAELAALAA